MVIKNCDNCKYSGRPSYEWPCTACTSGYGSAPSKWEIGVPIPADMVEVVRCKDCTHCVTDEEEPGMCKCVESAEYDSMFGIWLGFVEYHDPEFYCAYGERKDND